MLLRVNTIKPGSIRDINEAQKGVNMVMLATRSAQHVTKESEMKNSKEVRMFEKAWRQLITNNTRDANLEDEEIQKKIAMIAAKQKT